MDQIAPPQNAIAAVGALVARAGNEQDRLGWAIVQGELDRLGAIEQRARAKADAPRRLDGAASWDVARYILGEHASR